MRKLLLAVTAVALLVGCAQLRQQEATAHREQTDQFCDNLYKDQRLDVLRPKFPADFTSGNISLRHLSDESYVSQNERDALLAYDELRDQCQEKFREGYQKYAPTHQYIYESYNNRQKYLMLSLYKSEVSYGQFFQLWKDNVQKGEEEAAEMNRLLQQQAHESALVRQRAQAQASQQMLLQAYQNMNQVNQRPAMTNTNCRWVGNTLNCTTF